MAELLTHVEFASFLVYAPRPSVECARNSLKVRNGVKFDTHGIIALAAKRIVERWDEDLLGSFLGPNVLLVPAPRSSPIVAGTLWPSARICDELVARNLGSEFRPLIRRELSIKKSATAERRPTALQHIDTLRPAVETSDYSAESITIVDDIVTTGTTLLACASVISQALPNVPVRAFALVRTLSSPDTHIGEFIDPCKGSIELAHSTGLTRRRP